MRTTRIPVLVALMTIAIAALPQRAASQSRDERATRAGGQAWQQEVSGNGPFQLNLGVPK